MNKVKILIVAVNARNIHANPAVYAIKQAAAQKGFGDLLEIREYAIHTPTQYIMAELFKEKPDILAFSFYIWNAVLLGALIRDLKKLLPQTRIILGGPEASARAKYYLDNLPVDAVCIGEGENSFCSFLATVNEMPATGPGNTAPLPPLPGFLVKGEEKSYEPPADLPDLAQLPFLYDADTAAYLKANSKLVYYESSRGCPYCCAFCASARQNLRQRPMELVMAELPKLADIGGQIKFIDRTFNADPGRAMAISQAILRLYRPGLSWHFEVSPFSLPRKLAELWMSAPEDYFHLEIGVQTLNTSALAAVGRRGDWDMAEPWVRKLIQSAGCHVHLDLIAGLPQDTPEKFAESFHRLHQLNAEYLQFGFLKVLPGSPLAEQAGEIGLLYSEDPPYQILATPTMSPADLFALHRAERAFNALYNKTRAFRKTLLKLAERSGDALGLYRRAAALMPSRGLNPQEATRIVEALGDEDSY